MPEGLNEITEPSLDKNNEFRLLFTALKGVYPKTLVKLALKQAKSLPGEFHKARCHRYPLFNLIRMIPSVSLKMFQIIIDLK